MAYFHTTVLDNQIKALPTVDTASGSIATFDTDMTENLIEVKCQIVAQQSGSGTPSPSNPRPITVYTGLNLSHSGADTSNPTVYNIPFGQTVANGVLNVGTGKLTVAWVDVDLGTLAWTVYNAGNNIFAVSVSGKANGVDNLLCEQYANYTGALNNMPDLSIRGQGSANILYIRNTNCTTDTDIITALSGVKCIYELATPIDIQLDSITLQALLNENNIWCDTGDTEVKYLLTVGKKIS